MPMTSPTSLSLRVISMFFLAGSGVAAGVIVNEYDCSR